MALALGSQTGSLVNHVMSCQTKGQPEPQVGMGATLLSWTDRHAATIVGIAGGIVTVQADHARRVDANGMSESQTYEHAPNPDGPVYHFRFRIDTWEAVQLNERTRRWNLKEGGYGLMIGVRRHYHHYSF